MNLFLTKAMQSLFSYDQYEYAVFAFLLITFNIKKLELFFPKQNQHEATDLLEAYKESDTACRMPL